MASDTRTLLTAALLIVLASTVASKAAKHNPRPVHEVINEQARIDTKIRTAKAPVLPFGNPLAGNSQQNAKLHAQTQQAMYNAERIRQHKAQLQRWTKAPIQMDSYMKAYHESQENHQLALEQQQSKDGMSATVAPPKMRVPKRPDNVNVKVIKRLVTPNPDIIKITKTDAVKEGNRNHRSHGSVIRHSPKRYQTVYVSPGTTYDQGVTIKPHGSIGMNTQTEPTKLYTEAVPSNLQYVYPSHLNQLKTYHAQDFDTLSSLLKKHPQDQLTELNALTHPIIKEENENQEVLDTPIDLYFYLKDGQNPHNVYDQTKYVQITQNAYNNEEVKDHIPITEEVDDIEDPNAQKVRIPPQTVETTTMKSNNYYKVEVASQTITSGHTVPFIKPVGYKEGARYVQYKQPTVSHEDVKYVSYKPEQAESSVHYPTHFYTEQKDMGEKYLHHNAQHIGIQHLASDGTVSPHTDENLQYASNYEFGYRVRDSHSGNDFGHSEAKSGENTNGHYHVLLPDGRMQKVKYSAGPEGFHADISYDHLGYEQE